MSTPQRPSRLPEPGRPMKLDRRQVQFIISIISDVMHGKRFAATFTMHEGKLVEAGTKKEVKTTDQLEKQE